MAQDSFIKPIKKTITLKKMEKEIVRISNSQMKRRERNMDDSKQQAIQKLIFPRLKNKTQKQNINREIKITENTLFSGFIEA